MSNTSLFMQDILELSPFLLLPEWLTGIMGYKGFVGVLKF